MKYIVTGANRQTGKEISITMEAMNETDASLQAVSMGILVSQVTPAPENAGLLTPAPATRIPSPRIPAYDAIRFLGVFYWIIGVIIIIAGLATLGLALKAKTSTFAAVIPGCLTMLGGLAVIGIGQLFLAFRDIARNTWHLPHISRLIAASEGG